MVKQATSHNDRLAAMFEQQREFMLLLCDKRNFPTFPVDLTTKAGQKFIKDVMHHCMDELFESGQLLKNAKSHRATDIPDVDRSEYITELCDALHLFFEIVIASGISLDELYETYMEKGETNKTRINNGY